jgi:peptide/nickel transport system substrate-binding protein
MRLSAWFPLAALSAWAAVGGAATRPHYGGLLRVETRIAPAALDPTKPDTAPLASLVFEPLVRLDAAGVPQPCLAISWQHDASARHWQFNLRPGVKFQDGFPLVAAAVAASLEPVLPGSTVTAANDAVVVRSERSMPDLLLDLAHNGLVFAHDAEGSLTGTGPFRLTAWEPGRRATFAASHEYWGGRPFLDAIEVQMGRPLRDQLVDFEIGKADIAELGPAEVRRAPERGRVVWTSAPINLVALVFGRGRAEDPRVRQALTLSIDRAAMHNVLLQRQGDISAAVLPQWLSGYAFIFPSAPDAARARILTAALPAQARTLTLAFDPAIAAGRSLAERIAVNARDAGLVLQLSAQNAQADVRLVQIRMPSLDAAQSLSAVASALGLDETPAASSPEALYEAERILLEGCRVIPLFHLPEIYGVSDRVHDFMPPAVTRMGDWRFENLWLAGAAP